LSATALCVFSEQWVWTPAGADRAHIWGHADVETMGLWAGELGSFFASNAAMRNTCSLGIPRAGAGVYAAIVWSERIRHKLPRKA